MSLVEILVASAAVLGAALAFTVWRFKEKHGHNHATNHLMKRFFDGKECAVCKRPIPPVRLSGLRPGLLDRTTNKTYSWDDIPDADVPGALERLVPICSDCEVAEEFRQRFPGRAVDHERALAEAQSQKANHKPAAAD